MDWSSFVGLPWRDRGRGNGGYDCWGLLVAAFGQGTRIELPSYAADYVTATDRDDAARLFAGEVGDWVEISREQLQPFDVVVLSNRRRLHVGLAVDRRRMLHMPFQATSVIEPLSRVVPSGYFRHRGLI